MAERILCVLGKLRAGGVESIMYSYYRCLDKSKYQYDFIYEEGSDFDVPQELILMGARSFKVPSVGSPFKYINAVRRIVKNEKYRIVHSNMNTLSVFSLFASLLGGAKYRILHNHSTSSSVEKKRDIIKKILRPFNRMMTNRSCACSELAARWMYGDRAFENGKIKVFRNGVDVEKFKYKVDYKREICDEFDIRNKKIIGHVGRFMTQKNHMFIIDIFREYLKKDSNAVLMLIGGGELFDDVCTYAKEQNVYDSVIFVGMRNDVYKFYSAFDIFILPSLYEGLPVVGMEACASGLPVLLSDKVTRECAITDSVSFLPIDDPEVWAEKIQAETSYDRAAMAEKMAVGQYNIYNCVKELEDFYAECS